jgi:hypothetical protein
MSSRPPAGVTTTHTLVALLDDDIARGGKFFHVFAPSCSMRDSGQMGMLWWQG